MSIRFQYQGLDFHSLSDAEALSLLQLTHWLQNITEEREYLRKEYLRISKDKSRTCMLVQHGRSIALFVNKVA